MANLITDSFEWAELSELLYRKANKFINYLYDAFDEAQEIEKYVARQGDIGSVRIPFTTDELELLNEKRRKLVSFANGIHYEIYDLVDNPFCLSLSKTIDNAYKLNPSDIKVVTDKFLLWEGKSSLADLLVSTLIDKKLKKDFEEKYKALDRQPIQKRNVRVLLRSM